MHYTLLLLSSWAGEVSSQVFLVVNQMGREHDRLRVSTSQAQTDQLEFQIYPFALTCTRF
jgi:hypothetical protein